MKKILFSVFLTLCMVNSLPAVVVTTIEQLDELAATNGGFSFSIMGDNNGYAAYNYNSLGDATAIGMARLEPWIKDNDEFCLAVGDHAIGTRKYWYTMNETDPFWHNHYYPSLGDNCNGTDYFYGSTADQAIWGRGWVMFKALNNFFTRSNETEQIIFRQPDTNNPVYSSVSKANPDTLVPYPDQLCDYYVKRKQGNFTFHIISVNVPDPGVLAARSKDFMMNKLYELAAIKTDYDIIVVLAQKNNWLKRAQDKGWISRAERDAFMSIVDLTVNGDDHIYRRQNNFDADYNRTEALWMNSGAPASTGALWGYLNVHVFDNPPRFVVQYIDVQNQSTRKLHVNPVKKSSTQQAQPDADTKPIMKYVNGPYVSVDWNNFPMEPVANDAAFVSQTVPTVLNAGETTTVHVVMKNLGTNLWSTAAGHKLGTQTNVWTVTNRVALTNTVGEWADHTFTFNIIAPTTPGYYDFQWQMVDDLGADAGWFGPVTPVVSINVRTVEQVEHGTVLLRVDLHQNTGDTVPVTPAGFVGWKIGDVSSGVQAPGTNINGYGLTLGSGTSIACLTSASSQKGMNSRNRSTGYITNAGAFTQADMMRERVASADTPTAPSTGNGKGSGLYLSIAGLSPNTPYVFQAWGVDATGTFSNSNVVLKNGYNYGFDATRETNNYSYLPLVGNYSVSGSPATISDNNKYSVMGKITSDATGKIIYKQISNIDKSVMNGFVLSTVPPSNTAPVITSVPITNASPDSLYSYTLTATDPQNDPLVFSSVTEPSWLSFTASNRVLSGIPTGGDIGPHLVALRVSDGSLFVTQNFTITVSASKQDQMIESFLPEDHVTFLADQTVQLSATASSGLPVMFTVLSGPGTITNGTNLSFSSHGVVVVQALQAGNSSWNPVTNKHSFTVHGVPVAGAVTLDRVSGQILKMSDLDLLANSSDPENSALSIVWVSSSSTNGGAVAMSGRWITYTPPSSNDSPDSFSFRVRNGFGGLSEAQAVLQISVPENSDQSSNISSITPIGSNVYVKFVGIPGRQYIVQATTNLITPVWENIGTCEIGSQGFVIFTDENPTASKYYRTTK